MVDDTAVGVPGTHPLTLAGTDENSLAGAVKESIRRRNESLIANASRHDLRRCSSCGSRVILLDQPETFAYRDHEIVCASCGAERDLVHLFHSEADIGGEG